MNECVSPDSNSSRSIKLDIGPLEEGGQKSSLGLSQSLIRTIDLSLTSIPILCCCFTSGLIDANVFNAWGVFASMQTGNTVILALGASHLPIHHSRAWLQALMAILFFFLGAFFTSRICRFFGALRRLTLALSFLMQSVLIATPAALVQAAIVPGLQPAGLVSGGGSELLIQLVPLAMLAFQAGQQCVAARALGLNEIPTTVLTSVYCDLGNDADLFVPLRQNWRRNRRAASAILLLLGAIVGGWLSRTAIGMASGLWVAAGVKFCIAVAWLCWKAEKSNCDGGLE